MSKDKEKLTGTITELESNKYWGAEFIPFVTDIEIIAIVKVQSAEICLDSDEAYYVSVDCKALDCVNHVYNLHMSIYYQPGKELEDVLAEMKKDAVFLARGPYVAAPEIRIINAKYKAVPDYWDEQKLLEKFRANSDLTEKIQL